MESRYIHRPRAQQGEWGMDMINKGFIKQLPARCSQGFHLGPLLVPAVIGMSPWHFQLSFPVCAVCAPHIFFAFIAPLSGKD